MSAETEVCVQVLLDRAPGIADRPLTYRVRAALANCARIGVRAVVPLGPRSATGFIVGVAPCQDRSGIRDTADGGRRVRDIIDIPDPAPLFSPLMLRLAHLVADETFSTLLSAVRCLVPPEFLRRPPHAVRAPRRAVAVPERLPRVVGRRQRQLLDRLLAAPEGVLVADLVRGGGDPLKRLVALGAVRIEEEDRRNRRPPDDPGADCGPVEAGSAPRPVLLWGGASHRAVWISDAVRRTVARGGQAIVIAPEAELAEGLAGRLRGAVGERVAVFHSGLPMAVRRETWRRILAGDAAVVCGTRSALFAPLGRLRLLVVESEEDPSYKADGAPRYHARRVALHRGSLEGAQVVLGTASPSVEAYAAGAGGTLRIVRLAANGGPRVRIVDMRLEREQGRSGILSQPLVDAMRRHLRGGGRVALFANRVGYARVLACRECGDIVRCARCLLPMPYDRESGTIRCRVCGRTEAAPQVCPRCKGAALHWVGAGTKRIEEVVAKVFPEFRLARVDRETAGDFDRVASEFASGRLRLVVGTQLVLRGRRLRPSLVGVVDADTPLYRADFRASERTFQQLRAIAGLATDEVVVQTRIPDHAVLRAIRTGFEEQLYEDELRARREFGYPPYARLVRIVCSGPDAAAAAALADRAAAAAGGVAGVDVLGPVPAGPTGTRSARAHCFLRAKDPEATLAAVRAAVAATAGSLRALRGARRGRVVVDADPEEIA